MRRPDARPPVLTRPFLLVMAASFTTVFTLGMLLPTLPRYVAGPLERGSVAVGIVMGAASVVAVVTQPLAGRLGDRRGRRVLLAGGPLLLGLVTASYALADSLGGLLGLRLASGIAEAFFFVGAATVANDLAPDERRGEALSYYTLSLYAGLASGPLVGEWLLDSGRFDAVWLTAAAAAGVGLVAALGVPETRPAVEHGSARRALLHPAARWPGLILFLAMLGFGGFNAFVALYALELGLDDAGPLFTLFAVIVVAVRSFGARIPDTLGPGRTATLALGGLAVGLSVMGLWQTALGLYVGTTLFALGQSLAFPALMMLTVQATPPAERSSAIGSFTLFLDVALGIGAIALGAVAAAGGYSAVFVVAGVLALAALPVLRHIAASTPATAPA